MFDTIDHFLHFEAFSSLCLRTPSSPDFLPSALDISLWFLLIATLLSYFLTFVLTSNVLDPLLFLCTLNLSSYWISGKYSLYAIDSLIYISSSGCSIELPTGLSFCDTSTLGCVMGISHFTCQNFSFYGSLYTCSTHSFPHLSWWPFHFSSCLDKKPGISFILLFLSHYIPMLHALLLALLLKYI